MLPALLLIPIDGFAQEYRVAIRSANGTPEHSSYSLVYQKVLDSIGQITGDTFSYVYLPPIRVKKYFNEGKIDIEPGTNIVWRANEKVPGLYSAPFSESVSIILLSKAKSEQLRSKKVWQGGVVGTVRGFSYPTLEMLFANGVFQRFDEADETSLVKSIVAGRLQQVVISKHFATVWLSKNAPEHSYQFGDVVDRQSVSMRLHPTIKSLLPRMNKAIKLLIANSKMAQMTGVPMAE